MYEALIILRRFRTPTLILQVIVLNIRKLSKHYIIFLCTDYLIKGNAAMAMAMAMAMTMVKGNGNVNVNGNDNDKNSNAKQREARQKQLPQRGQRTW